MLDRPPPTSPPVPVLDVTLRVTVSGVTDGALRLGLCRAIDAIPPTTVRLYTAAAPSGGSGPTPYERLVLLRWSCTGDLTSQTDILLVAAAGVDSPKHRAARQQHAAFVRAIVSATATAGSTNHCAAWTPCGVTFGPTSGRPDPVCYEGAVLTHPTAAARGALLAQPLAASAPRLAATVPLAVLRIAEGFVPQMAMTMFHLDPIVDGVPADCGSGISDAHLQLASSVVARLCSRVLEAPPAASASIALRLHSVGGGSALGASALGVKRSVWQPADSSAAASSSSATASHATGATPPPIAHHSGRAMSPFQAASHTASTAAALAVGASLPSAAQRLPLASHPPSRWADVRLCSSGLSLNESKALESLLRSAGGAVLCPSLTIQCHALVVPAAVAASVSGIQSDAAVQASPKVEFARRHGVALVRHDAVVESLRRLLPRIVAGSVAPQEVLTSWTAAGGTGTAGLGAVSTSRSATPRASLWSMSSAAAPVPVSATCSTGAAQAFVGGSRTGGGSGGIVASATTVGPSGASAATLTVINHSMSSFRAGASERVHTSEVAGGVSGPLEPAAGSHFSTPNTASAHGQRVDATTLSQCIVCFAPPHLVTADIRRLALAAGVRRSVAFCDAVTHVVVISSDPADWPATLPSPAPRTHTDANETSPDGAAAGAASPTEAANASAMLRAFLERRVAAASADSGHAATLAVLGPIVVSLRWLESCAAERRLLGTTPYRLDADVLRRCLTTPERAATASTPLTTPTPARLSNVCAPVNNSLTHPASLAPRADAAAKVSEASVSHHGATNAAPAEGSVVSLVAPSASITMSTSVSTPQTHVVVCFAGVPLQVRAALTGIVAGLGGFVQGELVLANGRPGGLCRANGRAGASAAGGQHEVPPPLRRTTHLIVCGAATAGPLSADAASTGTEAAALLWQQHAKVHAWAEFQRKWHARAAATAAAGGVTTATPAPAPQGGCKLVDARWLAACALQGVWVPSARYEASWPSLEMRELDAAPQVPAMDNHTVIPTAPAIQPAPSPPPHLQPGRCLSFPRAASAAAPVATATTATTAAPDVTDAGTSPIQFTRSGGGGGDDTPLPNADAAQGAAPTTEVAVQVSPLSAMTGGAPPVGAPVSTVDQGTSPLGSTATFSQGPPEAASRGKDNANRPDHSRRTRRTTGSFAGGDSSDEPAAPSPPRSGEAATSRAVVAALDFSREIVERASQRSQRSQLPLSQQSVVDRRHVAGGGVEATSRRRARDADGADYEATATTSIAAPPHEPQLVATFNFSQIEECAVALEGWLCAEDGAPVFVTTEADATRADNNASAVQSAAAVSVPHGLGGATVSAAPVDAASRGASAADAAVAAQPRTGRMPKSKFRAVTPPPTADANAGTTDNTASTESAGADAAATPPPTTLHPQPPRPLAMVLASPNHGSTHSDKTQQSGGTTTTTVTTFTQQMVIGSLHSPQRPNMMMILPDSQSTRSPAPLFGRVRAGRAEDDDESEGGNDYGGPGRGGGGGGVAQSQCVRFLAPTCTAAVARALAAAAAGGNAPRVSSLLLPPPGPAATTTTARSFCLTGDSFFDESAGRPGGGATAAGTAGAGAAVAPNTVRPAEVRLFVTRAVRSTAVDVCDAVAAAAPRWVAKGTKFTMVDDVTKCTHFVVAKPGKTEALLRALCVGAWILQPEFLRACIDRSAWADEAPFEWVGTGGAGRQSIDAPGGNAGSLSTAVAAGGSLSATIGFSSLLLPASVAGANAAGANGRLSLSALAPLSAVAVGGSMAERTSTGSATAACVPSSMLGSSNEVLMACRSRRLLVATALSAAAPFRNWHVLLVMPQGPLHEEKARSFERVLIAGGAAVVSIGQVDLATLGSSSAPPAVWGRARCPQAAAPPSGRRSSSARAGSVSHGTGATATSLTAASAGPHATHILCDEQLHTVAARWGAPAGCSPVPAGWAAPAETGDAHAYLVQPMALAADTPPPARAQRLVQVCRLEAIVHALCLARLPMGSVCGASPAQLQPAWLRPPFLRNATSAGGNGVIQLD